jgi:protein-disulfide isomerase
MKNFYLVVICSFLITSCQVDSFSDRTQEYQKQISQLEKHISFLDRRISELEKNHSRQSLSSPVVKRNIIFELDDGFFDDPYFGSNNTGKIMIIYTDLNCKTCRDFLSLTLPKLKKQFRYSEEIQIRIRDFPLSNSLTSRLLGMGAHCAGEKGKYWEFLDAIISSEIKSERDVIQLAGNIMGLDAESISACIKSDKYLREIELDKEHGKSLGIKGTPGIIIGKKMSNRLYSGTVIRGSQPLGLILEEINFLK